MGSKLEEQVLELEKIHAEVEEDSDSGYKGFIKLHKNLCGILDEVHEMKDYEINIDYYDAALKNIEKKFNLVDGTLQAHELTSDDFRKKYLSFSLDFENNSLAQCNKELELLIRDFEENVTPIYNVYKLFNTIDKNLNDKNELNSNYNDEIIQDAIKLLKQINYIHTGGKIQIQRLIERAYKSIYSALLYEAAFEKNSLLRYIKENDFESHSEYLGEIIRKNTRTFLDEGLISEDEVNREFINNMSEGLGYDYLSSEYISKLSNITYEPIRKRYVGIKNREAEEIASDSQNLYERIKTTNRLLFEKRANISKLKIYLGLLRVKTLSFILVPLIAIGAGSAVGAKIGNEKREYATTTRQYDLMTETEIGSKVIEYDDRETNYVATIEVYDPWKKKSNGGYTTDVTAYEFETPENISGDYHIEKDDIQNKLREKYTITLVKDELAEEDSMTDTVFIVTETYQDKTNSRPSKKYIYRGAIGSGLVVVLIEYLLFRFGLIEYAYTKRKWREQIDDTIYTIDREEEELFRIKDQKLALDKDKKNILNKIQNYEDSYGKFDYKSLKKRR